MLAILTGIPDLLVLICYVLAQPSGLRIYFATLGTVMLLPLMDGLLVKSHISFILRFVLTIPTLMLRHFILCFVLSLYMAI